MGLCSCTALQISETLSHLSVEFHGFAVCSCTALQISQTLSHLSVEFHGFVVCSCTALHVLQPTLARIINSGLTLILYFVSSRERPWRHWARPIDTRCKTHRLCINRAVTSVYLLNTRWRHGRSRGETKYKCQIDYWHVWEMRPGQVIWHVRYSR